MAFKHVFILMVLINYTWHNFVWAGNKSKPLKPRLYVDFTRIADSGTPYSERMAAADFGFVVDYHPDSHLYLVDQTDRIAFEKVLRAIFPARKTGPDDSGGRFGVSLLPSRRYNIGYAIKFPPHFLWATGGTLPGLCGGLNCHCSAGPRSNFVVTSGWSPRGQLRLRTCTRDSTGRKIEQSTTTNYTLPKNEWVELMLDVQLNDAGQANGFVSVTVNNTLLETWSNLALRHDGSTEIDTFLYATFFASPGSAPMQRKGPQMDIYADFDDITLMRSP